MKIIYDPQFFHKCKYKHLLLDTSFFIDASIHKKEFSDLVQKFKDNDTILVTIDSVKTEFCIGAEDKFKLRKKIAFMENIIDAFLPTTADIFNKFIPKLVRDYGQHGRGVSIVDITLAAFLIKYNHDLFLLTKNPKDFPKVTNLESYFLLDLDRGLQVYAALLGKI